MSGRRPEVSNDPSTANKTEKVLTGPDQLLQRESNLEILKEAKEIPLPNNSSSSSSDDEVGIQTCESDQPATADTAPNDSEEAHDRQRSPIIMPDEPQYPSSSNPELPSLVIGDDGVGTVVPEVDPSETESNDESSTLSSERLKYTWEARVFICFIICFEVFFAIFSFFLVKNAHDVFIEENKNLNSSHPLYKEKKDEAFDFHYHVFIELGVMMFLGFGLLYSYLKHFGYFAIAMSVIICALTVQMSVVCNGYGDIIVGLIKDESPKYYVELGLPLMIQTLFAGAATLISTGALIGKFTPLQFIILVMMEIPVYAVNNIVVYGLLEIQDVGCSITVHAFAAYFGLMCSFFATKGVFGKKGKGQRKEGGSRMSSLFSIIGTVSLWILWPSFNCAFEDTHRHRVVINTYVCLISCCLTTAVTSRLFRIKFGMGDLQNATLAGGVIIGASCNHEFPVGVPVVCGGIAGLISVLGYRWGSKMLFMLRVHDPAGINNLHGIPGILGGLISVFSVMSMEEEMKWKEFQPLVQLAGVIITLIIGVIGGIVTGLVIRCLFIFYPPKPFEDSYFDDKTYFLIESNGDESMVMDEIVIEDDAAR